MKYIRIILMVFLCSIISFSYTKANLNADYPIIFIHGNRAEGTVEKGLTTWGNTFSAMCKISNEEYKGYHIAKDSCTYEDNLPPTNSKKVMYNFSFYNTDASRGVIGSNGKYYPVIIVIRGT